MSTNDSRYKYRSREIKAINATSGSTTASQSANRNANQPELNGAMKKCEKHSFLTSFRILVLIVLVCMFISFTIGQLLQIIIFSNGISSSKDILQLLKSIVITQQFIPFFFNRNVTDNDSTNMERTNLNLLTEYTFHDFSHPLARSSFSVIKNQVLHEKHCIRNDVEGVCYMSQKDDTTTMVTKDNPQSFDPMSSSKIQKIGDLNETIDLIRLEPYSIQLLIDIENVNQTFLRSQERLTSSLTNFSNMSSWPILSYHCHESIEVISCVGIFVKGHINLLSWHKHGVISIDILNCESPSNTLLDKILSDVQSVFVIPVYDNSDLNNAKQSEIFNLPPHMRWSYKRRGFSELKIRSYKPNVSDMQKILENNELEKEIIHSEQTDVQLVDIYDVIEPRFRTLKQYELSLSKDDSYESMNPDLFKKDRIVYINGTMVTRRFGEVPYHEALIHPAMFAHPNPKRVLIVGSEHGSKLREVLKHNTVKKVISVNQDELFVNISKLYLSEWNDCSNLMLGMNINSCFDDPRSELYFDDPVTWFTDHFGDNNISDRQVDVFDVVILDFVTSESGIDEVEYFFHNKIFLKALSRSLGKEGILVTQVGKIDNENDPPDNYKTFSAETFINALIDEEFQSLFHYFEPNSRHAVPRKFLVAMKDVSMLTSWVSTEAELEVAIRKRTVSNNEGGSPFQVFDGSSNKAYEFQSRVSENKFCRGKPHICKNMRGLDPDSINIPPSSFRVGISSVAKGGRGVFTNEFIPEGAQTGLQDCFHAMYVPPKTLALLESMSDRYKDNEFLRCFRFGYVDGYGWYYNYLGRQAAAVDAGIFTFVNHGCYGTHNIGEVTIDESTADDEEELKLMSELEQYNVYNARQYPYLQCADTYVARRNISPGEEILDNYLYFGGSDLWEENQREIKVLCTEGTGTVAEFEEKKFPSN